MRSSFDGGHHEKARVSEKRWTWCAYRVRAKAIVEAHSLSGDSVEIWRLVDFAPIAAQRVRGMVICHDEKDIRPAFRCLLSQEPSRHRQGCHAKSNAFQKLSPFHDVLRRMNYASNVVLSSAKVTLSPPFYLCADSLASINLASRPSTARSFSSPLHRRKSRGVIQPQSMIYSECVCGSGNLFLRAVNIGKTSELRTNLPD